MSEEQRRAYQLVAQSEPHNHQLQHIVSALVSLAEQIDDELDPDNTVCTVFSLNSFWDGEGQDTSSDESGNEES